MHIIIKAAIAVLVLGKVLNGLGLAGGDKSPTDPEKQQRRKLVSVLDAAIALTSFSIFMVALPSYFRENLHQWTALVNWFGNGDAKIATFWMTHAWHLILFGFFNTLVGFCYYYNLPSIERFKTEPGPWPWQQVEQEKIQENPDPDTVAAADAEVIDKTPRKQSEREKFMSLLSWTAVVVTLNNLFISVPLSWFMYDSARASGFLDPTAEAFPSFFTICWQIAVCIIVEDTLFYWSHRLLHQPLLFRWIHKVHHQYHVPVGVASEYAHPLEFYFGNVLPTSTGPALVKAHLFTYLLWLCVRLAKTCEAHSGYAFPFSVFQYLPFANSPRAHDYHHHRGIHTCFGSFLSVWDTVAGTNKEFMSESGGFKHQQQQQQKAKDL